MNKKQLLWLNGLYDFGIGVLEDELKKKKEHYEIYRLYYQPAYADKTSGNIDGFYLGNWKATTITFKARTSEEAMRKANKFWQEGSFGRGSITVKKEATTCP